MSNYNRKSLALCPKQKGFRRQTAKILLLSFITQLYDFILGNLSRQFLVDDLLEHLVRLGADERDSVQEESRRGTDAQG